MINVCLISSALLIVKVIFVITVFYLFLLCVSTISVNKDDHSQLKLAATSHLISLATEAPSDSFDL